MDQKIKGLHKRLKGDLEDMLGKVRADQALIQADQKVHFEKLTFIERFMDRIRASNTYGEPIVNFNEDSVTKVELKASLEEEARKMMQQIKLLRKHNAETEPVLIDVKEDVALLKDLYKKS